MEKTFSVLGGDQRQLYLAELLEADGHRVGRYGFEKRGITSLLSLKQAAEADCVVLPLPVTRDGERLHMPLSGGELPLEELWQLLQGSRAVLCGGAISETVRRQAAARQLTIEDYFDREEVQVANAVPTAEGAVYEAMAACPAALHGAKCLIIGYGRIGKVLAHRLQGLHAQVSVSARRLSDLAWIEAYGCRPLRTGALSGHLGDFDLVFNTVPVPLLCRAQLQELKESCVVVDLASAPGGVDLNAAAELGVPVRQARGLPGKAAPLTAAKVLRGAIYHILEERGEPI